jgi:hypothetical protein
VDIKHLSLSLYIMKYLQFIEGIFPIECDK